MPGSLLTRSGDVQIGRDEPHHTPIYGTPVLFRNPGSSPGQWVSIETPGGGFQPFGPAKAQQTFWPRGDGHGLSAALDSVLFRDIRFTIWIRGADHDDLTDRIRAVWRVAGLHVDTTTPTEVAFQVDTDRYWCRARCVRFELRSETGFAGLETAADVTLRMLHPAWFPVAGVEYVLPWAYDWPHWTHGYDVHSDGFSPLVWRWEPPFDLGLIDRPEVIAERQAGAGERTVAYAGATTTVSASTSGGPRVWTAKVTHTDESTDPGLWLSGYYGAAGDYAICANTSSFHITGDIDVRWYGSINATTGALHQVLVSLFETTGQQRSWALYVEPSGQPGFALSPDGNGTVFATVTGTTLSSMETFGLRATWQAAGGTVTIYESDDDGASWTPRGTEVVAGITAMATSSAGLQVGGTDATDGAGSDRLGGIVDWVEVRSGVSGTVVASPDFGAQTAGTTQFTDGEGNVWDVEGATASIGAAKWMAWPALADIRGVGGLTDPDRMIGCREGTTLLGPPTDGATAGGQAIGDYFWFDSLDQEIWLYDASADVFHRVDHDTRFGSTWFPLDDGRDHELVCFPQGPQLSTGWLNTRGASFVVATTGSATVTVYDAEGLF